MIITLPQPGPYLGNEHWVVRDGRHISLGAPATTTGATAGTREHHAPCRDDVAQVREEESWDCVAREVLCTALGHNQHVAAALWRSPTAGVACAVARG